MFTWNKNWTHSKALQKKTDMELKPWSTLIDRNVYIKSNNDVTSLNLHLYT